jgi:uncharacterized iron-regulated membrane protein
MVMIRRILFWVHLTAGVTAGIVILIMCVTGTLLTFQQSVLGLVERAERKVRPPAGHASRLDVDTLLAKLREARPGVQPATLTFDSDPETAVTASLGAQGVVFIDPYTGTTLGSGSPRARALYRTVTNWHRWLAMEGDRRPLGRAITGACNAAFLLLAVSGLYLWIPRQWTARHVGAVALFRRGLSGKARDFNWHNTIGLWSAPILIVLTATGMVISYTWAGNLVYTLTGSPLPSAGRGGGPAASSPVAGGRGSRPATGQPAQPPTARTPQRADDAATLEPMFFAAQARIPTWNTIVMRMPARAGAAVSFTISDRGHWNPFARSTLTFDPSASNSPRWEPYAGLSPGQRLRGWMRFAHTGELGGLAGEAIAGLASAGGAVLVYTGVALALRRLASWRERRAVHRPIDVPTVTIR